MNSGRTVAVWRETVLPPSETFIANQTQALRSWRAHLVGAVEHKGGLVPGGATVLYPDTELSGRWRHRALQATGRSRRLRQLLRSSNAQLVHAHFGTDAGLVLHSARTVNLPLVTTFHGQDATVHTRPWRQRLVQNRLQAVLRESDAVIAVSRFVADELSGLSPALPNVVVLPIGIPIPRAPDPVRTRAGILFVGRLVEKKGCIDLLEAVHRLPVHLRRTPVTVVGEGPCAAEAMKFATRQELNVSFLGVQSPKVVQEAMWRTRVFCVPSKRAANGDAEGLGMVFLEASACEAPVVSYDHGGVPEAVRHGTTGLLVPEGDISQLSTRLALLLGNDLLAERMGRQGRSHVVENHDIAMCTPRLERLYEEVVEGSTTRLSRAGRR